MSAPMKDKSASRRRSRVYGVDEPHGARSSAVSLASNVTSTTNVSTGSVATVTPDSYLQSRQPGQRRKKSKRRNYSDGDLEQSLPEFRSHNRNINVFEFLVEEPSSEEGQTQQPENEQHQPEQPRSEQPETEEPQAKRLVPGRLESELSEPERLEFVQPGLDQPQFEPPQPDQHQLEEPQSDQPHVEEPQPEQPQFDWPESLPPAQSQAEQTQPVMIAPDSLDPDTADTDSLQVYKPLPQAGEADLEGYYKSQLSDSGISMGSSIGDAHLDTFLKQPLPPLMEEVVDYPTYGDYPPYAHAPSVVDPYYHHDPQMWGHFRGTGYTPEPIPLSPASIRNYPHPYEHTHQSTPDPPSMEESKFTCLDSAPLIFRDKRGKKTSQPHIFRSFAHLNARVLLQMQSNITDLEHELALLDAKSVSADAHRKSKKGESHHSRHFTKDQSLRADIYQELHTSLEQYYDTLSSFNQVKQMASSCDATDVTSLKSWLQAHVLPISKIDPLIGDGSDLVRLGPSKSKIPNEALRIMAYCILTNVFAPLLLFKVASGLLSRLTLLAFTTTITTLILDRHRSDTTVELGDVYCQCIIGCAGVSFFAAIFF